MASKTIRWALTAAFAAAVSGCGGQPAASDTSQAKDAPPKPRPTATAKEQTKKRSALSTAED